MKKLIKRMVFALIILAYSFLNSKAQDCDAGTISGAGAITFICDGEFGVVFASGSEGNTLYILHNGNDTEIGTIYATSSSGIFTNDGTLPTNQELCISSVAGSEVDASGIPDLNGTCYDISECSRIVFLSPIEIEIGQECNTTTGLVSISYAVSGGAPEYLLNVHNYNISGPNGYTNQGEVGVTYNYGDVSPTTDLSFSINDDGKGCSTEFDISPISCSITNSCNSTAAMSPGPVWICDGELGFANGASDLESGHVICYILHDSPTDQLGTIYGQNSSGIFSKPTSIPGNTLLYVSAIVGPPSQGGCPEIATACQITDGAELIFLSPISIDVEFECVSQGYLATVTLGGGAPQFNQAQGFLISGTISGVQDFNIPIVYGPIADNTLFSIDVGDSKFCDGSFSIEAPNCNITNVWPGDKNNDGIVDQKDVSIIGFLYETGPPRATEHQNTDWYGHPCEDWNDNLPFNGANIKHLDCNGDGTISTIDADAVLANLGETHDEGGQQIFTPFFEETNYQIYLQPIEDLDSDNLLKVNVVLESKSGNNLTLQGGYFTVDYNNINTNTTIAAMNFLPDSWLGIPNINMITSFVNFPNTNQIEIGFSKTNGTNSTGKGIIGQLTFVLDNNAMRTANALLDFEVIEIGVHDSQGNIQPIEEQLLQVGLNESNCQTNWTITEDSPFYNVYKSNGTIATDGFVLVGKEQQVQYSANRVSLEEGFSVRAGADFKVRYGSCN